MKAFEIRFANEMILHEKGLCDVVCNCPETPLCLHGSEQRRQGLKVYLSLSAIEVFAIYM